MHPLRYRHPYDILPPSGVRRFVYMRMFYYQLLLSSLLYLGTGSIYHLRGTNPAKKCEMYAGVTGSAVYDSNICYICELPPHNNTFDTVTKLCSNGESPFIYFSIYIP